MKKLDLWTLLSLAGLSLFSLFTILGVKSDLFPSQLLFFTVGAVGCFAAYKIGADFFRLNSVVSYSIFILLLILTFLFGENIRGSRRWINLFIFNFQTSEFFKPIFILFMADLFASKTPIIKKTMLGFLLFSIPALLILKQPDLGNAIIYSMTFFALLYFAGLPIRFFISGIIAFFVFSPLLWHFLKNYQKERIISFINPKPYSQDISYNLIQSIITVGSGAFFGRGLGLGTQSRFQFLPEFHTDFAYASLVEQFGFVGGILVILFFGMIMYRLFLRARKFKKDPFRFMFLSGVIVMLLVSVFINIGMNLGILPVTGVALPLISYGGSSILSTFILLGLALSI